MKKKLVSALLVLSVMFMLTGCFEVHVSQKITGDGIITETMEGYVNKQEYINYVNNLMNAEGAPVVTAEYVDKEMFKEGYEIEVIDGVEYYANKEDDNSEQTGSIAKWYKLNRAETAKGGQQIWERGFIMNGAYFADEIDSEMSSGEYEVYDKKSGINQEAMLQSYYIVYSVEFDSDIVSVDENAVIDPQNPKKVTWRLSFDKINKDLTLYALCNSDIQVSGVVQGKSYKKAVSLHYDGAVSAVYNGQEIANDKTFNKHGQHTVILKAASGEQRTVTFFIDKKKPVIKKLKNNKTYKKHVKFAVKDKDSGIASVAIDGKKKDVQKSLYTINKKGRHRIVVKDNAGNTNKVKIKIK